MESPYDQVLDRVLRAERPDLTPFLNDFRAMAIHRALPYMVLSDHVTSGYAVYLRGLGVARPDPLLLPEGRWQTGLDLLVYAINYRYGASPPITLDLSNCDLKDDHLYMPSMVLSHIAVGIKSMNLSGNHFMGDRLHFLFENLWDGGKPTFGLIDCRSNTPPITWRDVGLATTKHPGWTYVLHTTPADLTTQLPSFDGLTDKGVFVISAEKTATYYMRNGVRYDSLEALELGQGEPSVVAPIQLVAPAVVSLPFSDTTTDYYRLGESAPTVPPSERTPLTGGASPSSPRRLDLLLDDENCCCALM